MAALAVRCLTAMLLAVSAPAYGKGVNRIDNDRSGAISSGSESAMEFSNENGVAGSGGVEQFQRGQKYKSIYDCVKRSSENFVKGFEDYVGRQSQFLISQYKDGNAFDKHCFYQKAKFADFQSYKQFDVKKDKADYENEFSRGQIVKFNHFQNEFYKNEQDARKFFFDKQFEFFDCVRQSYKA